MSSLPVGERTSINYLDIFFKNCLFFLFTFLFTSIWSHVPLFHTLVYNPILHYSFCSLDFIVVIELVIGVFHVGFSCPFDNYSRLILNFSASTPKSAISDMVSREYYVETKVLGLGVLFAPWYVCLKTLSKELGNIFIYNN